MKLSALWSTEYIYVLTVYTEEKAATPLCAGNSGGFDICGCISLLETAANHR